MKIQIKKYLYGLFYIIYYYKQLVADLGLNFGVGLLKKKLLHKLLILIICENNNELF